jgi:hypothetical protein
MIARKRDCGETTAGKRRPLIGERVDDDAGQPPTHKYLYERGFSIMPRYLIEVPHSDDKVKCARAIQVFLQTGSHFLVNADWGCMDGEHKAWIIMEADNKEDVLSVLPLEVRPQAKIVRLAKFSMADVEEVLRQHQG